LHKACFLKFCSFSSIVESLYCPECATSLCKPVQNFNSGSQQPAPRRAPSNRIRVNQVQAQQNRAGKEKKSTQNADNSANTVTKPSSPQELNPNFKL